jgi:hypothetical protein
MFQHFLNSKNLNFQTVFHETTICLKKNELERYYNKK